MFNTVLTQYTRSIKLQVTITIHEMFCFCKIGKMSDVQKGYY